MATPEQMQILITAQTQDAVNDIQRLAKQLDGVSTKSIPQTGAAMGAMGKKAGQAGIQIQQLVGQVQGGVSPMVALSQQAADLGFVLGVPLAGAVAGIVASLAGPFIQAFFGASDSVEDLVDKIKDLNEETRTMTEAQKALIALNIGNEIADLTKQREKQLEIIRKINAEAELEQFISEEEFERLKRAEAQRDTLTQQIEQQRAALAELNKVTKEQSIESLQLAANYGAMYTNLDLLAGAEKVAIENKRELAKQTKEQEKAEKKQGKVVSEMAMRYADYYTATDIASSRQKVLEEQAKKTSDNIVLQVASADKATDAYQEMADRGLGSLEDGLVGVINGTKSASDAFRDMATSIVNDMIRMQIQQQITGPLSGALGAALGGMFGGTGGTFTNTHTTGSMAGAGRATGGPVSAGSTYLVGERGPELFTAPAGGGTITSNSQMGGPTVVQNINISTGVQQTVRTEIATLMPQIANAAKSAVLDARRRGGSFAGAFG